ncbi:hypothetical protein DDE05_18065 [Streptomyces cavourensis]|nr:hypothetical protein DDE05_18065 [Streptomyces cavourensis]
MQDLIRCSIARPATDARRYYFKCRQAIKFRVHWHYELIAPKVLGDPVVAGIEYVRRGIECRGAAAIGPHRHTPVSRSSVDC